VSESNAALIGTLGRIRVPFFLASEASSGSRIVLHTTERRHRRELGRSAAQALAFAGIERQVRVAVHRATRLTRYRSLETLVGSVLGQEAVLFDPTQFVTRASLIVALGTALRTALGAKLARLFMDTQRRTLFVVLDRQGDADDAARSGEVRAEVLAKIAVAHAAWQRQSSPNFDLAIRVGFEPPAETRLVAVDALTARHTLRALLSRRALAAAWASLFGIAATVPAAAQGPAVSQPNFSVDTRGALFDDTHFGSSDFAGLGLKGDLPLGELFGFQGEAAVGTDSYWGVGGHLFTRDPDKGLVGVIGSYEQNKFGHIDRVGGEGSAYLGPVTIDTQGGYQRSTQGNGFFGKLDLSYYATPDFKVTGGVQTDPQATFGHAGFEWQPAYMAMSSMSIYADGRFGNPSRNQIMAGLKFHFGGVGKSLKDRDRRDDPDGLLFNTITQQPKPTTTYH
jgi:hypothetical protein